MTSLLEGLWVQRRVGLGFRETSSMHPNERHPPSPNPLTSLQQNNPQSAQALGALLSKHILLLLHLFALPLHSSHRTFPNTPALMYLGNTQNTFLTLFPAADSFRVQLIMSASVVPWSPTPPLTQHLAQVTILFLPHHSFLLDFSLAS